MLAKARMRLNVDERVPDYRHVTDKGDCQCQGVERRRPLSALLYFDGLNDLNEVLPRSSKGHKVDSCPRKNDPISDSETESSNLMDNSFQFRA